MLKKNLPLIIGSIAAIILAIGIFSFSKPDLNFDKNTSQTTSNSSQKTTSDNSKSETTVNQSSSNNSTDSKSQVLSNSELAKFDGKNSNKCYIGYKNKVYDINDSKLWDNGVHTPARSTVKCGQDNTQFMKNAPHGEEVLRSFEVVGSLN